MSQSSCLYDEGEWAWPVKLHLGCGGIFLRDYINVDIEGLDAKTNPTIAAENTADIKNYYAGLDGDAHHLPQRRTTVADLRVDITALPYTARTVDKIVAIQVFEHLSPIKAIDALYHWHRILKHGQPLVMSVPDMAGTLDMIERQDDIHFALRHLRGRESNHYNSHHAWYTTDTLSELVNFCGFVVNPIENFHFYPAICIRGIKR